MSSCIVAKKYSSDTPHYVSDKTFQKCYFKGVHLSTFTNIRHSLLSTVQLQPSLFFEVYPYLERISPGKVVPKGPSISPPLPEILWTLNMSYNGIILMVQQYSGECFSIHFARAFFEFHRSFLTVCTAISVAISIHHPYFVSLLLCPPPASPFRETLDHPPAA